jgi:hypothetical protein
VIDQKDLGSFVMSALTGTMMGRLMSADEVCCLIVENGWAAPDGLRDAVVAELGRLGEAGLVVESGPRYGLSTAAIASILG